MPKSTAIILFGLEKSAPEDLVSLFAYTSKCFCSYLLHTHHFLYKLIK